MAIGDVATGDTITAAYTNTVRDAAIARSRTIACSDEETAIDATGTKATFRMPEQAVVTGVRASLTSACTTGTLTVDVNVGGTSLLSTKLTVDATEKTSVTASTAPVLSTTAVADDSEVTIDVDNVGDGTATGLKVTILYDAAGYTA